MRVLIATLFAAIACFGIAQAADVRTTADVDRGRIAEFDRIFGTQAGVVMGYTADDHNAQVWHEGEAMGGEAKAGDMAEGEKCGMHEDGGCCCKVKCGCQSKCGCNTCHKSCGCNSCHKSCGCNSCGGNDGCGHWDCWGVWNDVNMSSENIRDSDEDEVLGDGGRGTHRLFGWGGW